jgi:hypothetical protein
VFCSLVSSGYVSKVSLKLYPQAPSQLAVERETELVIEFDEFNTLLKLVLPEEDVAGFSWLYDREEIGYDECSTLVAEERYDEKSNRWLAVWLRIRLGRVATAVGFE